MSIPLRTRFADDLKTAMKSGERMSVDTLRLILAKLKDVDMNARVKGQEQGVEAEILSMLQGMIKQRQESIKIYRDNNRPDLLAKEEGEVAVIEKYLPKQMSDADLAAAIDTIVKETGATGVKDMGKVMGAVKERLAGQADMTKASAAVKARLAG